MVYISIGSRLESKSAKQNRINNQQFPLFLQAYAVSHPHENITVILVSPTWGKYGNPIIIDQLEGFWKGKRGESFVPFNMTNVTIRIITGFINSTDEGLMCQYIHSMGPEQSLIVGDYTLTEPFQPFDNFRILGKCVKHGHTRFHYVNSRDSEILVPLLSP
jgi:hypothetical protein